MQKDSKLHPPSLPDTTRNLPLKKITHAASQARNGANCWIIHSESIDEALESALLLAKHALESTSHQSENIKVIDGKDGNIPISAIRELAFSSYTDSNALSINIINASRVAPAAFNVLLKPMEESSIKSIWILYARSLSQIPITIISRCKRLYIKGTLRFASDSETLEIIAQMGDINTTADAIKLAERALAFANRGGEEEKNAEKAQLKAFMSAAIQFWKNAYLHQLGVNVDNLPPATPTTPSTPTSAKKAKQILHSCIEAKIETSTNATSKSILYKLMLSVL